MNNEELSTEGSLRLISKMIYEAKGYFHESGLAALVAGAAAAGAASAATIFSADFNDFTNGKFPAEQYDTGNNVYAVGDVPHWTHSSNGHAIHAVERSSGDFAVMFYDTDIIYYDTPLAANTLGQTYVVSFEAATGVYYDPNQLTGPQGYLDIRINDATGVLASYHYTPTSSTFSPASFTYTGKGTGNVYLLIQDGIANDNRFAGALDNISVASVPEPASWSMLIMGFGAMGAAVRRHARRNTKVRFG